MIIVRRIALLGTIGRLGPQRSSKISCLLRCPTWMRCRSVQFALLVESCLPQRGSHSIGSFGLGKLAQVPSTVCPGHPYGRTNSVYRMDGFPLTRVTLLYVPCLTFFGIRYLTGDHRGIVLLSASPRTRRSTGRTNRIKQGKAMA